MTHLLLAPVLRLLRQRARQLASWNRGSALPTAARHPRLSEPPGQTRGHRAGDILHCPLSSTAARDNGSVAAARSGRLSGGSALPSQIDTQYTVQYSVRRSSSSVRQ